MIRSTLLALLGGLSLLFLASCASSKEPKPYDDNISKLPQNRPQSWEGSAAMGSFFPQSM